MSDKPQINIVKSIKACIIPLDGVQKVVIEGRLLPIFEFQPKPDVPPQQLVEVGPGEHYRIDPVDPLQELEVRSPIPPLELALETLLLRVRQLESQVSGLSTSVPVDAEAKNQSKEQPKNANGLVEWHQTGASSSDAVSVPGRIVIDVGGTKFATMIETLQKIPNTWFTEALKSSYGAGHNFLFVDRDPTLFGLILNYLRDYPASFERRLSKLSDAERELLKAEVAFYKLPLDLGRRSYTNPKLWQALSNVIEQDVHSEPVLLYQASWDGSTAEAFHKHCDHKGATVIFAICEDSSIFGAYLDLSWTTPITTTLTSMEIPNAVLFSYSEKAGVEFFAAHGGSFLRRSRMVAHMCASLGPCIGFGPDFEIHFGRSMMLTGTPSSFEAANIPLPWAELKDVEVWRL